MKELKNLPWKEDGVDRDHIVDCNGESIVYDEYRIEQLDYIVQACNSFPEAVRLLKQITEDLAELQNNTNDLALDALYLFYDRMCANVTDVEQFLTKLEEDEH